MLYKLMVCTYMYETQKLSCSEHPRKSVHSDPVPCSDNRRQTEFKIFSEYNIILYEPILTMFLLDAERKERIPERDKADIANYNRI